MPANNFDYAVIRVVPRVDRGEFLNAGVILFCRVQRFLAAVVELDETRLAALAPDADQVEIRRHLDLIPAICRGGPGSGPIGALSQTERFHWLVSPRSSVIQTSPVHCGLSDDPEAALRDLVARLVLIHA
ncbi:MAG TPA: DUF3037 domain-containing protein [Chloroflexota bacterium]|nr:DUF3037 domain-containing protein [Chloroflexota bacterium]